MFGMACWAAGDILWTYYDLVVGEVPYPSIADAFYLVVYPFFLIGILRIPRQVKSSTSETWYWLDILIIMFSAGSIYWNFLIGPALSDRGQSWLAILVNSAYPFGDLLLILVITLIIFLPRSPLWLKPLALMLVGHSLSIVADGVFAYQTLNETYSSGAFFNILFSIGPLALMMSGLSQAVTAWQVARSQKTSPVPSRSVPITLLRLAIPFIWLIASFTLLRFSGTAKQALSPAGFSLLVSLVIILLAVRQVIATLDNNRLADTLRIMNDHLEKRVAERASDLLTANSELRREMEERKHIEMMLREREEKLAHFALHDALTTLPNRSLLATTCWCRSANAWLPSFAQKTP
jgi:hypothetical protein